MKPAAEHGWTCLAGAEFEVCIELICTRRLELLILVLLKSTFNSEVLFVRVLSVL
jgi:hypothetical protein